MSLFQDFERPTGFSGFDAPLQARRQFQVSAAVVAMIALALVVLFASNRPSQLPYSSGFAPTDAAFAGALTPGAAEAR